VLQKGGSALVLRCYGSREHTRTVSVRFSSNSRGVEGIGKREGEGKDRDRDRYGQKVRIRVSVRIEANNANRDLLPVAIHPPSTHMLHCTVLYCTTPYFNVLQCTALHLTLYCSVYCPIPYCTTLCHTALYCTVLHVLYRTVLHNTTPLSPYLSTYREKICPFRS
jgi:hypothetical protein